MNAGSDWKINVIVKFYMYSTVFLHDKSMDNILFSEEVTSHVYGEVHINSSREYTFEDSDETSGKLIHLM